MFYKVQTPKMYNDVKFLTQKSTWQKAVAELGGHFYMYGHKYFGFAVTVKLQGNANIERNIMLTSKLFTSREKSIMTQCCHFVYYCLFSGGTPSGPDTH